MLTLGQDLFKEVTQLYEASIGIRPKISPETQELVDSNPGLVDWLINADKGDSSNFRPSKLVQVCDNDKCKRVKKVFERNGLGKGTREEGYDPAIRSFQSPEEGVAIDYLYRCSSCGYAIPYERAALGKVI